MQDAHGHAQRFRSAFRLECPLSLTTHTLKKAEITVSRFLVGPTGRSAVGYISRRRCTARPTTAKFVQCHMAQRIEGNRTFGGIWRATVDEDGQYSFAEAL